MPLNLIKLKAHLKRRQPMEDGRRSLRFLAAVFLLAPLLLPLRAEDPPGSKPETKQGGHPVPAIQDTETAEQRQARMGWWREARFGMFIHWGLYSIPGGYWKGKGHGGNSEWIMNSAKIPVAEYKQLAAQFNPTEFSAEKIVSLAKAAGMKYIVITAKHHDGFAMYASQADPFNIVTATPFQRDPLKELAEECRKQGLKLGFYYSQAQDWTAPGGVVWPGKANEPNFRHWDRAQDGDFDAYLKTKAIPQLKELLHNYGEFPAVIWFDTSTPIMTPERSAEIVQLLNQYPKLIWNNRLGGGYPGDTKTPEQTIPVEGYPGEDWESCMTINDHWGFHSTDLHFKPTQTLLWNLIDIASKGGNYLLNIGPDAHGVVPAGEVERLQQVGQWLATNGEAIYGTTTSIVGGEPGHLSATEKDKKGNPLLIKDYHWRSTTKPDKLYLMLLTWPQGRFHLEKMPRTVTGAYFLADHAHQPLKFTQTAQGLDLELPPQPLDPIATVVVLQTSGPSPAP